MRKLVLLGAALLVGMLVVAEAAMQPSVEDRLLLSSTFGLSFLATIGAGWGLLVVSHRFRSLRTTVLMIPITAIGVAAVTIAAAALTMFLSAHDLRLTMVALALGVGLGTSLALTVSRPLAGDLDRLAHTARQVAGGNLTASTAVDRPDEVGQVARAMDGMIGALARAEDQRRDSDESRRSFLAAVSHDLRTPLTSLQAAVEALQDGVSPDPERYLRSMARDLQSLRGLVDDLFTLTRIEVGDLDLRPITLDTGELVEEILEAMRPLAESRGVELKLETHRQVPVEADPRAVARVVRNLVDNAIRHTAPHTAVRLRVAPVDQGVEVRVLDQGPGFPAGFGEAAWKDAAKGDPARSRDGTGGGLGMTIARGLVEAHRGEIWVEYGEGGQVAFRLPARWSGHD